MQYADSVDARCFGQVGRTPNVSFCGKNNAGGKRRLLVFNKANFTEKIGILTNMPARWTYKSLSRET